MRSVRNAIKKLGFTIKDVSLRSFGSFDQMYTSPSQPHTPSFPPPGQVESPLDIANAERLMFPGVGAFGQAMEILEKRGYTQALRDYIAADRPFMGICLGLQLLFDGSEESGGCEGLGLIPGTVAHFDTTLGLPVPHIGWNDLNQK